MTIDICLAVLDTRYHRDDHVRPSVGGVRLPLTSFVACGTRWFSNIFGQPHHAFLWEHPWYLPWEYPWYLLCHMYRCTRVHVYVWIVRMHVYVVYVCMYQNVYVHVLTYACMYAYMLNVTLILWEIASKILSVPLRRSSKDSRFSVLCMWCDLQGWKKTTLETFLAKSSGHGLKTDYVDPVPLFMFWFLVFRYELRASLKHLACICMNRCAVYWANGSVLTKALSQYLGID